MATALDSKVALISLSEAKEYLKVTSASEDAIITHLLNDVSAWVARYLHRNLVSATYTEYYSGDNSKELLLRNYPVSVLTSIHVDSLRVFGADTLVADTSYILRPAHGIVRTYDLLGGWYAGFANIKVVYTAGYTIGADSGVGTMPYEIRLAVNRILDRHYRGGYTHRSLDRISESQGGMNISFRESIIPSDAKEMLASHKAMLPSPQYSHAG